MNNTSNNNNNDSLNDNKVSYIFRATNYYNNAKKARKNFYNILSQNYNNFIMRNKYQNNNIINSSKETEEDYINDSKNHSSVTPHNELANNTIQFNNNRTIRYIDNKTKKEINSFVAPREKYLQSIEINQKRRTKLLIDEIISGRNNPYNIRANSKIKLNKYKEYRFININNI